MSSRHPHQQLFLEDDETDLDSPRMAQSVSEDDLDVSQYMDIDERAMSLYLDQENRRSPNVSQESARERRHAKPPRAPTKLFCPTDSLSTIPSSVASNPNASGDSGGGGNVKEIYGELMEINDKLKAESRLVQQKSLMIKEREKSLSCAEASLQKTVEEEVQRRLGLIEQQYVQDIQRHEHALKERNKENKRLKENFDTLKGANDVLRKQLEGLQKQQDKLEKQNNSLQSRITNLQKKRDFDEKKAVMMDMLPADISRKVAGPSRDKLTPTLAKRTKLSASSVEVVSVLVEWVAEDLLRPGICDQPTRISDTPTTQSHIQDKSLKILPHMIELVRELPSNQEKTLTPCLQFIYWTICHMEQLSSQQKSSLSVSLRRLGEELYKGRTMPKFPDVSSLEQTDALPDKHTKDLVGVFLKSSNINVRFLSAIVILKTVTQVDHLAQVYEILRGDLKTDTGKELFLHYQATPVMLTHLKPTTKALSSPALDLYLQMSMDSPFLQGFLESCSRETWFQAISMVWRRPGVTPKELEKLSIILQKLSKIRLNKKYFEVFGLSISCQELLRTSSADSPFLILNLKSILFNLNTGRVMGAIGKD